MPKVPFPHILSSELEISRGVIRVVTDEKLSVESTVKEKWNNQLNKKTGLTESVYNVFYFDSLDEQRPARGDWSAWDTPPTFYRGRGGMRRRFESELSA